MHLWSEFAAVDRETRIFQNSMDFSDSTADSGGDMSKGFDFGIVDVEVSPTSPSVGSYPPLPPFRLLMMRSPCRSQLVCWRQTC